MSTYGNGQYEDLPRRDNVIVAAIIIIGNAILLVAVLLLFGVI